MHLELPQFSLEDNRWWTATVLFPSWNRFQSRNGDYGSRDRNAPSDGSVRMVFAPEGRGTEPLTNTELSTIHWVIEHESLISTALLESLVKEYPSIQKLYGYSEKEKMEFMPDIESAEDLRLLVGLSCVYIHQVQKDGMPYVGFEFGCTWDEEHGLGVLMHGTRTVEIGSADTAFLLWLAKEEASKLQ